MASLKQLRDIFAPILAEHPNLVLRRRWLFRPPIENAIVGLDIGRTAYASMSDMTLSVLPLSCFEPQPSLGFARTFVVERVIGAPRPSLWSLGQTQEKPNILFDMFDPEYQSELIRNFTLKVVPFLDSIRTTDEMIACVHTFRAPPYQKGAPELVDGWVATMHGQFATAAACLQAYLDRIDPPRDRFSAEARAFREAIRDILLTNDPTAIAAHLHTMEERTIAAFGLQRFWRRTPFPFERA